MDRLEAQQRVEIFALFLCSHYSQDTGPQVSGSQTHQSPTLYIGPGATAWFGQ